jgi:multiple sugar transport system permease protein
MKDKGRIVLVNALIYVGILVIVIISFFPIYFVITTSFKQTVDAFVMPPKWIFTPTMVHHYKIWLETDFGRSVINSIIIALGTVGLSVPVGTLAGFYFARNESKMSRVLLFLTLIFRMTPPMLLVIPFFFMARSSGLYDTHLIMILIMVATNQPFTIWLMRGFFLDIPPELDEAAMMDGCSRWGAFWRVILPVTKPGLGAAMIFSFLLAYNAFFFPLILTGTRAKPATVAIAEYGAELIQYWSISCAGVSAIMGPMVIFMIVAQKQLVKGLTFGAVKK